MKHIEELLSNLSVLEPIETGVAPNYTKDNNVKAVVFDIYGTLLVSSSGDLDQAEISEKNLKEAFEASNIKVLGNTLNALENILRDFEYTIKICHAEAKKNNVPYPEIDIMAIWEIVLLHARRKRLIEFNGDANIIRMTCIFEFLSNKVYPMPQMQETLLKLSENGIPLGIVSNAQFYTPVVMNYFLNRTVGLNEDIMHFDPELTVYSYRLGIGKPDTALFEDLVPILKRKYKLRPSEVLFVGNDMLKDIYASSRVGFKTALFAGDKRSLRMRAEDSRINGLKADHIITELHQVLEIVY
jgi:putative hydrolase of the HAD superfamily